MSTWNTVPDKFMKRILREFSTLPMFQGKIIVTFEMDCGMGGTINKFKVKRFTEDEER